MDNPLIEALANIPTYTPAGHSGTTNRRLVTADDCLHFEMVTGSIEPGGVADPHLHETEYQAMLITGGRARVTLGDQTPEDVDAGSIVRIPPGVMHQVESLGPGNLELVIVYSPPISRPA